ncbi:MAG: hypothetical protein BGN97_04485 [Microbacterium sp. 69-10]|uniref:hypothetical protein n=1 Tax=Microbacterium sp. 69-10 TaxID=1895783 RepID=UPI00095D1C36|nr:hypothetical protein [Microbacterium sp. 69-10]OJU42017.1 MAG: hypothetical protein BGN97_04485 [Microbacterium sp. 69-10]
MPIKIDFLANVRGFLKGTDDVDDALDDVADSLDDMADAAKKGGRDAERSVEKLEDNFRDAARRAKDLGDSGKDAGRDVKRGMDDASEGVEEFRDEANSTAREAAASFDGSAESIVDAFQEIAANAFAGFGPAGAVAGLAAAAGIGLAVGGFEQMSDAEQASRERAAEWADAYVEAGSRVLTAAISVARQNDIATDPERFKEASDNAKNWGVDVSTAIAAMAGQAWALNTVNDNLVASSQKVADEMSEVGLQYDWTEESMTDLATRTADGQRAFDQLTGEMAAGAAQADALSRSLYLTAKNTEGATTVVDEFGDTVTTLPDGTTIYIDAETGQATKDTQALEDKIYGIRDKNVNITARTDIDRAAYDAFLREMRNTTIKIKGRVVTTPDGGGWDR